MLPDPTIEAFEADVGDAVTRLAEQEATSAWPAHVGATIADLAGRPGHGV